MLVKVRAQGDVRARIMELAEVFRVNIVDVTATDADGRGERQAREARGAPRAARASTASSSSRAPGASRSRAATAASASASLQARRRPASSRETSHDRPHGRDRGATHGDDLLREGHRPGRARRSEDRRARVRVPGSRARAEPAGLGLRRAGRPASRFGRVAGRPRTPGCACSTPPTRSPRPTS